MSDRYYRKIQDPCFVAKERERGREKYHRLYKGKKSDDAKKKEALYTSLRNAKRDFHMTVSSDFELHHWNYNVTDCVILLDKRLHHKLHKTISCSIDEGIYYQDNNKLDTLEKHLEVIKQICENNNFDYTKVKVLSK